MHLIATDEAGYGPKLGPLVVVATAWELPCTDPSPDQLSHFFAGLSTPAVVGDLSVRVDDSKRIYRRQDGLAPLHAAVSAGLQWCTAGELAFPEMLLDICREDVASISEAPWLSPDQPTPLMDRASTQPLIGQWRATGIELVAVQARVITARRFNAAIDKGFNKADLLSQSTLGLVSNLTDALSSLAPYAKVFCDRHGGRRYYAAPIQHQFPEWALGIISEAKDHSRYRLSKDATEIEIDFTVKGDQFPPVAFSSLVAKYLRERFMESLNAFFQCRHQGNSELKQTAGYPVDADRFLAQIAEIRDREGIKDCDFIRCR